MYQSLADINYTNVCFLNNIKNKSCLSDSIPSNIRQSLYFYQSDSNNPLHCTNQK
jgi:hypothetical protein